MITMTNFLKAKYPKLFGLNVFYQQKKHESFITYLHTKFNIAEKINAD